MADDVINQLLFLRAIPGVSFNFIAYVEPEILGRGEYHPTQILDITKLKILEGLRHMKYRAPSPVAHSLTNSLSLPLDLGKCSKLFFSLITTLFTLFFRRMVCFYRLCFNMWKRIQQLGL